MADDPRELVVVDQFEELYTLCEDPERRDAFIDGLLALSSPVVIGVRADLYGKLGDHAELARAVADNQVLLGAMGDEELERAITEPARVAGLRLEPGLVELILRDVAREPGALPLLSHALRVTWEQRDGRTLTVEGYRASGGVASAIAQTADSVVEAVPPDRQGLMRNLFLRLTELGEGIEDTRRRVAVEELVPEGASPEEVQALLDRLAEARLVTLGEGTAEVAHEVLIREWPTLRAWLEEDRAGIRLHRQLGDAARLLGGGWARGGRPVSRHAARRGAGMGDVAPGRAERRERAFLDASVAESERERRAQLRTNRRLRVLLAGVGAAARRRRDRGRAGAARERPLARRRPGRGRPAPRRPGPDRRPARAKPAARTGGARARRLRRHPRLPALGAGAPPRRGRRDAGRRRRALRPGAQPRRPDPRRRRRLRRGRSSCSTPARASASAGRCGSTETVQGVDFSPDGRLLAVSAVLGEASGTQSVKIVDLATRKVVREIDVGPARGHAGLPVRRCPLRRGRAGRSS